MLGVLGVKVHLLGANHFRIGRKSQRLRTARVEGKSPVRSEVLLTLVREESIRRRMNDDRPLHARKQSLEVFGLELDEGTHGADRVGRRWRRGSRIDRSHFSFLRCKYIREQWSVGSAGDRRGSA